MITAQTLRASAEEYEKQTQGILKPTRLLKLQRSLEIKGNSPLLHITGFDPVEGRGVDAQHQLLGPVEEAYEEIVSPLTKLKDARDAQLFFTDRHYLTFPSLLELRS